MSISATLPLANPVARNFAALCLFALPFLALLTSFGMDLVQLLFLIGSGWLARHGLARWYAQNWRAVDWIILAFAGYFFLAVGRKIIYGHSWSSLDAPARLLFALSCIGLIAWIKPPIRLFWIGLCLGSLGACLLALLQKFVLGIARVEGFTHHPISFGDMALAMGAMSLCASSSLRHGKLRHLPWLAMLGGFIASLLSGSRGAWLALPLLTILPLLHPSAKAGRLIAGGALAAICLLGVASQIPTTGVAQRLQHAISDVEKYVEKQDATTSVGIRLELWKASWMMFQEKPLLGVGRENFAPSLQELGRSGQLQNSPALSFASSHNDALYFLATGGLLDFSFLLLIYGAPFAFFLRILRSQNKSAQPCALAGVILVLCFIGFGLTDVMFWLMRPTVFYAMMVGVLTGLCLANKEEHD